MKFMMLKFIRIPRIKKLSDLIEGAKGDVYLRLSDEKILDLKECTRIAKDLEDILQQGKDIVIHIFDAKDCFDFANFMVGTTYDKSACI